MNKKNNVILIGFMGSGKTTFGEWLAKQDNMAFVDTDEYIVKKEGRSINEIFAVDGEMYFRDLETDTIRTMCKDVCNSVISVGGGLPVREENRKLLKELGVVVYLETSKEELVRRLSADTTRPLLAGGNLQEKITSLMDARETLYIDGADIIVHTDDKSLEGLYEELNGMMNTSVNR